MEFSDLKKYIFHFQGGYRVAMKAAPELLAEGLSREPKWIYTFDDDGNLERSVALQHVLSIESEEAAEEGTHFDDLPDEVKQVMEESIEDYKAGRFVDFDTSEQMEEWLDNKPMTKTELIGIEVEHFRRFYRFSEAIKIIAKEYDLATREVHGLYSSWVSSRKSGVAA